MSDPCAPAAPRVAPPKARPGYGKRSVPEERPPCEADFASLPVRERHIAGYVTALAEGAAMDIKSLAKSLPLYGQMAVGSALRALSVAGHLRRGRCVSIEDGQVRWVTRTFWSRVAHDNEWWTTFLAAENDRATQQPNPQAPAAPSTPAPASASVPAPAAQVPQPRAAEPVPPVQPQPQSHGGVPSPAFAALARLGRVDSRLALSAADCAGLEGLVAEWFARGVDADYLTRALTAGLPDAVGSPFGLVRRRLQDKLPPSLPATPAPPAPAEAPVRRVMPECTECGVPGRPEAFRDGLCRPCREPDPTPEATP
ncbi:MarR family transcriptional regulator [Streptomyces sp. NPDC015144]|uniref:MarR family transcriptional regulator n=1 Tax=Streptomyces sp. NPDC015144 TaxID=3364944 RepID=UPI0036F777A0